MKKNLLYYYAFLILLLFLWTDYSSSPNILLRLAYIVAVFAPTIRYSIITVPILICFTAITSNSVTSSLMPTEIYYYAGIMAILTLLHSGAHQKHLHIPVIVLIYLLYVLLVDGVTSTNVENIGYCILVMFFCFFFIQPEKTSRLRELIPFAFIVSSLVLAVLFFIIKDQFVVDIQGQERHYWNDPNYFGAVVGMGVVLAYNEVVNKVLNRSKRLLFILVVALGIIALALNASRGAALSTMIAIAILTIFSKVKTSHKVIIVLLGVAFLVLLYNLDFFSVLEERLMNDDDKTGNNRTVIWEMKIAAFLGGSFAQRLFGFGNTGGLMCGVEYGFHNDYIAHLVDYGVIGALLFLSLLFYPVFLPGQMRKDRIQVIALTSYMMVTCFTIEPITAGKLPFFLFLFYIIILANDAKRLSNIY